MFEARLVNGDTFKKIIEGVKDLITDTNVDCSEEEIYIQCMDSSHVALVWVSLSSSAFEHYRCDRSLKLGINTGNMSKILKMMGKEDSLVLKADDQADVLTMMFENEKSGSIADFELKLMEIDTEQLHVPETQYKCSIKMPVDEFQRIVRDMQVLGDSCTIACTKEGARFTVQGDLGTGNILVRANAADKDENRHVVIDMEEPVELQFALRYLNFFTKCSSLSKSVIINMSPDLPMVVEYPMEEIGYVKFYLAPKIDDDAADE